MLKMYENVVLKNSKNHFITIINYKTYKIILWLYVVENMQVEKLMGLFRTIKGISPSPFPILNH